MKRIALILCLALGVLPLAAQQTITMTIDQCVDQALETNPSLLQMDFYNKMTEQDVTVARANFMPRISASLGYNHGVRGPSSALRIDTQTGIPVPLQPFEITDWSTNYSLSASQTLFNGGYNYYNYKSAKNTSRSTNYELEEARQMVIFGVRERYFNLLKQQELLAVQEKSLEQFEESYKQAKVMYEVGKVPKSDMLSAKVERNQAELNLIEAQNLLSVARASLNQVLGFTVDREIQVVDDKTLPELTTSYEEAAAAPGQGHPTLLKNTFSLAASQNRVRMAQSQFLPSISTYYRYSWSNQDFDEISKSMDTDYAWSLGLSLNIPIFEGLTRIAQVSRAKLSNHYSEQVVEQSRIELSLEVKEAFYEARQNRKKINVTEDGIEAAEANLQLAQEKYRLGSGTMLDLIQAQSNYTQAQSNYIQAIYDYKLSHARLQRAMGRLTH